MHSLAPVQPLGREMSDSNRIFDEIERTDKRFKYFAESSFDYYNNSAQPGMASVREIIERWYEEFPDAGKTDIRGRLRSGRETNFLSAFFELYLCQLCRRSGYSVDIYPDMASHARRSHPDFILSRDGEPSLYLEATLAQDSDASRTEDRRLSELKDAINRVLCPDFSLWIEYGGAAKENIAFGKLQKRLQKWVDGLEAEQVTEEVRERGNAAFPAFPGEYGGLTFTITARPRSPENRGTSTARPLGLSMPDELLEWDTNEDIREAVRRKAKRYGDLKLPYIVAINVMKELFDFDDILDGLFGPRTVELLRGPDGISQHRVVRRGGGALTGKTEPRNAIVSGVLIANNLIPRTIGIETPLLIHNPWAQKPISPGVWRLPQKTIDLSTGAIISRQGLQAREILGIPEGWPTPD